MTTKKKIMLSKTKLGTMLSAYVPGTGHSFILPENSVSGLQEVMSNFGVEVERETPRSNGGQVRIYDQNTTEVVVNDFRTIHSMRQDRESKYRTGYVYLVRENNKLRIQVWEMEGYWMGWLDG